MDVALQLKLTAVSHWVAKFLFITIVRDIVLSCLGNNFQGSKLTFLVWSQQATIEKNFGRQLILKKNNT